MPRERISRARRRYVRALAYESVVGYMNTTLAAGLEPIEDEDDPLTEAEQDLFMECVGAALGILQRRADRLNGIKRRPKRRR